MVRVLEARSGTKTCICENCGSKLEYMPSEITSEKRNMDYLGDFDWVEVIPCPQCGEKTKLK